MPYIILRSCPFCTMALVLNTAVFWSIYGIMSYKYRSSEDANQVTPSLLLMQEAKLVSTGILMMTYFLLADQAFRIWTFFFWGCLTQPSLRKFLWLFLLLEAVLLPDASTAHSGALLRASFLWAPVTSVNSAISQAQNLTAEAYYPSGVRKVCLVPKLHTLENIPSVF